MISNGNRKLIVLAPALWVALAAGVVGLFTGDLPPEPFSEYMVSVLSWGGGIFALSNVLEHAVKKGPQ